MQLHVFQKAADKDLQIRIQSDADRAVEREDDRSGVFGVTVYGSTFLLWIHDSVFLDSGLRIQSVLCGIIHPTTGRIDNFNDPVRSTETAMVMELVPVADYGDIRFHPIFIIGIQVHGERGHKQLAVSSMREDIFLDHERQPSDQKLVLIAGWGHIIQGPVYQFGALTLWKIPVVF